MQSKTCQRCGSTFTRPSDISNAQWHSRLYCGRKCAAAVKRLVAMAARQHVEKAQVIEAFLSHVEKRASGCWEWTGATYQGYGLFTCRPAGLVCERAHRVAWALFREAPPGNAWVLHRCDNPPCVNPAHLFLGDSAANASDMVQKGRQTKGERNARAKLREAEACSILRDLRLYREIAADYDISLVTVSDIKRGRSWGHLPRSESARR